MSWRVFVVVGWTACLASYAPDYYSSRASSLWGYFTPPLVNKVPSNSRKTAMDAMVDLTNNLGVSVLQDHSYSRGNFAFSPYGVASVLVVLYEGTRGESARQIYTAVGFPADKDLIRIGFRDIHRHLRSYFSHEGYLSGISLNKDASSLKPEYKKILRFYGYNIDLSQAHEEDEMAKPETAATETIKTTVGTPSTTVTIPSTTASPPKKSVQTTATSTVTEEVSVLISQSTRPAGQPNATVASTSGPETTKPTTEAEETPTSLSTLTVVPEEKVTTVTEPEMESTTAENSTTAGAEKQETKQEESTTENLNSVKPVEEAEESTMTTTSESWKSTTLESTTKETEEINTDLDNGMLIPQLEEKETTPTDASTTVTEQTTAPTTVPTTAPTTVPTTAPTTETTTQPEESSKLERNRKSLLSEDDIHGDNRVSTRIAHDEDPTKRIRNIINTKVPLWLGENTKKPNNRIKRTLTDYLKSPHSPDLSLQLQNGMYGSHVSRNADLYRSLPRLLFLVDGAVDTPVPMMTYTNVFPFAYIPRLHAKALEFPLDDVRYKLLILLPVERRGLRQLIYDLKHFPLGNVLTAVKPSRVKAMVPTFMVEGFVILTSSLQKLGIWDVFDPRKANLSGMSPDPELYVRNVEQSVTVVIRNYVEIVDIQTRTMAARQMEHEFEATHPFLYFVLDTATNVALMAGQILDPLNSRIY